MSYQITQTTRGARGGVLTTGLGLALMLGAGLSAQAGEATNGLVKADTSISLAFDFIGNGFRVLKLDFDVRLSGDTYQGSSRVKTKGLGAFFANMTTKTAVSGTIKSVGLLPEKFGMTTKTSKKKRKYLLNWARDGRISVKRTKPPRDYKLKAINEKLSAGMPDPMTAIIDSSLFQYDRPCSGNYKVFDGKEVYALKFSFRGKDVIGKSAKGAYRGEAFVCDALYTPIAGLSHKKMAKYRKDPIPPLQIWMAPVRTKTFAKPLLVPVKVKAEIDWISTVGYLRKATVNGKALNDQSYAKR